MELRSIPQNGATAIKLAQAIRNGGCATAHVCETCRVRMLSICAALDLAELSELEEITHTQCHPPRTPLMVESEPSGSVFNITAGMVRLSKILPDGRRQVLGFAVPGDFLGLDMEGTAALTAEAIDTVSACRIPRVAFADFLERKPHLMRRLHQQTAHELILAQQHMVVLGRRSAEEKLATFLFTLRERLGRVTPIGAHVPLAMSRQDIADYLGLTIETVSRTFGKLAKRKVLVVTPDGVRILDPAALEALATG